MCVHPTGPNVCATCVWGWPLAVSQHMVGRSAVPELRGVRGVEPQSVATLYNERASGHVATEQISEGAARRSRVLRVRDTRRGRVARVPPGWVARRGAKRRETGGDRPCPGEGERGEKARDLSHVTRGWRGSLRERDGLHTSVRSLDKRAAAACRARATLVGFQFSLRYASEHHAKHTRLRGDVRRAPTGRCCKAAARERRRGSSVPRRRREGREGERPEPRHQ